MFNNLSITNTPKHLKYILILVGLFSLLPRLLHTLIPLLGLSLSSFINGFFWQPITFLFMQPNMLEISFNSILQLFLYIFAVYTAGSEIIYQKNIKSFYVLFFLPGILAALFLIAMMLLLKTSYIIFGLAIPTYCLLTAYVMLGTNAQLLVFHTLPIKIPTIIFTVFCVHLFLIASNISIIVALAHLLAVFVSYLYCLKTWKVHSPFPKFHNFEKVIIRNKYKSKIYDFTTGKAISDAEIIDEILDNANEKGLNKKDKERLKKFFQRKKG